MQIKIGCDPELFIFNKNTGLPVSAHDIVPGTKENPCAVLAGAIQVDGVAAEFNTEPAATVEDFCNNIYLVKGALWRYVRSKNEAYVLKAFPAVSFTRKLWNAIPEEAKQLGCTPDYNAYTNEKNPPPDSSKMLRTGSGHLHISWSNEKEEITESYIKKVAGLVRHLDAHLLPESKKWDDDVKRASLYGKPGAFRPKSYGVEYRVLSNKWVEKVYTQSYVFNATKYITERWLEGRDIKDYNIMPFLPTTKAA